MSLPQVHIFKCCRLVALFSGITGSLGHSVYLIEVKFRRQIVESIAPLLPKWSKWEQTILPYASVNMVQTAPSSSAATED